VLTITSIDRQNKIADNANTGEAVDFALPGVRIFAPYKTYAFIDSGTSLAAPHAAAAAALIKSIDKTLDQEQILAILKHYTVDLGAKGFDTTYGWGSLDLSNFDLNIEPITPHHTGDVNHDNSINILDATALQRYLALMDPSPFDETLADVDNNARTDINDVTALQRQIAGLQP
jgi:subtilisin family serine protease